MTIDFHTHIYPDTLAEKALSSIVGNVSDEDYEYNPVTDGTLGSLLKRMDEWGIDISLVHPVLTKQTQFIKTNEWAMGLRSDRIIPFGGLYPHTDDYKRDIDLVVSMGFKGIKLHAEYQDFVLDEPKMLRIYDYAFSRGLIIIHHAGEDPSRSRPYKSSPKQFLNVVRQMRGGILVAAHLGGHAQWDDVERYLVGENIYLDTAMGFEFYPHDQFLRIVQAHGADRILFASDSPWSSAGSEKKTLLSMMLPEEDKQKILGLNAARLLGISPVTM